MVRTWKILPRLKTEQKTKIMRLKIRKWDFFSVTDESFAIKGMLDKVHLNMNVKSTKHEIIYLLALNIKVQIKDQSTYVWFDLHIIIIPRYIQS